MFVANLMPDCVSFTTLTRCLQKVTEAKRDREEARRALDLLVQSPVNNSIGPSYRNLIMNRISNERLATARRQVGHILEQFEHACVYALSVVTWVLYFAINRVCIACSGTVADVFPATDISYDSGISSLRCCTCRYHMHSNGF